MYSIDVSYPYVAHVTNVTHSVVVHFYLLVLGNVGRDILASAVLVLIIRLLQFVLLVVGFGSETNVMIVCVTFAGLM